MTGTVQNSKKLLLEARSLGNTEQNWCHAVASGTGITVLALQMAKSPPEITSVLDNVLEKLQKYHPLLTCKLHYNPTRNTFSFIKSTTLQPHMMKLNDAALTSSQLHKNSSISPLQSILEHELNSKNWSDPNSFPCNGIEPLFATVYALSDAKSVVVLRLHTSMCDRTTAVSVLREVMELVGESDGTQKGIKNDGEGEMGIESLIPTLQENP